MAKPLPPKRNLDDVATFQVSCKSGAQVFAKGDDTRDLYVIDDGAIELVLDGTVVATLGPGDYFGERSFFHGGPRDVSARASAPSRLFRLDPPTFEQLVAEAPEIGVLMLARRARESRAHAPAPVADAPVAAAPAAAPPAAPAPVKDSSPAAPAKPGPGRLEVAGTGRLIELPDQPELKVGRADPRAGITPEVDLTADDTERTVGRRHARLVRRDGKLFAVEDKASANGTFVNDTRLVPLQEVEVHDGARLRFGAVATVFRR